MEKEKGMTGLDRLIASLPPEWMEKVTMDYMKMKNESPTIIDPELERTRFTVSAIIQPEEAVRQQIHDTISPFENKYQGLFVQPQEGLHFSAQWSELAGGDISQLTSSIKDLYLPPLELEIKLAFPSKPNLFAVMIPKSDPLWMSTFREILTGRFASAGFTPKLPEKLPTIWMSLARFTKDFDLKKLDELIADLPEVTIPSRKFTFYLAKTDPFFTRSTSKILFSKDF